MGTITEWEFTADVASWINEALSKDSRLPFSRAKCEQREEGSLKRRDLTLLDKDKRVVLTGEVKLPYQADGGSPHNEKVVQDALEKATAAKSDYFFTWNVNECVLWKTFTFGTDTRDRMHRSWVVTNISNDAHFQHPMTIKEIKKWLPVFINDFAEILLGRIELRLLSPDEKFIRVLESALKMPINLTLEELVERYEKARFKSNLDKWMREEQGWVISDDPNDIKNNLENTAKFTCYALVNKLVFYEALLKRHSTLLDRLEIPQHIQKGDALRLHLERYFAHAKDETGDYETVFGEDHRELGNLIPFYSDSAVVHWRELINQIHHFDFSKLDYEVIGNIFERFISPEERHKYGQYYTRPEVVDLINSFCIHNGNEKVMDPACGGGTFLVRAYARKRNLNPGREHKELLSDLYGIDISHFASHLTTINLATRDLIDDKNYPRIARSDFFNVRTDKPFLFLPNNANGVKIKTNGMGKSQQKEIEIPLLDAVVGNPPYVRQEDLSKSKKKGTDAEPGTKEYYAHLVKSEWNDLELSGRSDLHCYFWPHAATFLKDDGYLCLLTSSQWLDVDYGFKLQGWILDNFEIFAVMESLAEPWFIGARVTTTVTILHRQSDVKNRMENIVRFVQLRRPLKDIMVNNGTSVDETIVADEIKDEILGLTENTINDRYRAMLVKQGDLWEHGVKLGWIIKKNGKIENITKKDIESGIYYGGKWGVFLRAPDLWFRFVNDFDKKLSPLGDIADVRFGVKSGKDCFFFPIDVSEKKLKKHSAPDKFRDIYGVERNIIKSGKVKLVLCGEGRGEIRPLESKYLEPEIHSLMEIEGFEVRPENCSRQILLVDKLKRELKDTYVLDYINWGEKQGFHKGATCASRVTENKEWYDLTGHKRAPALWPKERQYRHIAPANDNKLIANCRLYEIYPPEEFDNPDLWGGILNSTWTIFSSFQFGRPVGNEGNWSTMVIDVNMMLVPDPRKANKKYLEKISKAFRKLKERKALFFLSEKRLKRMAFTKFGKQAELEKLSDKCELDMSDRRELDLAVLEMLGVSKKNDREHQVDDLYKYLREFFESIRQKEEAAIENKKRAKRRGPVRPNEIAAQIYNEIQEKEPKLLRKYDSDFLRPDEPYDVFDLPSTGEAEVHHDLFMKHGVRFMKGKRHIETIEVNSEQQAKLLCLIANSEKRRLIRIPRDDKECKRLEISFGRFINSRQARLIECVEDRTADKDMKEKICDALLLMLRS
jgi:hypothetical protein